MGAAYDEGIEAYLNGRSQDESPYDTDTDSEAEWMLGWCAAQEAEK